MVGEGGCFFSGPHSSPRIHYLFTALCWGHTEQPLPYQSSFLMGRNLELALDIATWSSPQKSKHKPKNVPDRKRANRTWMLWRQPTNVQEARRTEILERFFFFCMELGPEGEEEEKWHLNYRSEGRREGGREVGRLRGGERGEREGGKEFNMEEA